MNEKIRQEIKEYLKSEGYIDLRFLWIGDGHMYMGTILDSDKCKTDNLYESYSSDPIKLEKYFLEFIGHILRKHNIKEFIICDVINPGIFDRVYVSNGWEFDNIGLFRTIKT